MLNQLKRHLHRLTRRRSDQSKNRSANVSKRRPAKRRGAARKGTVKGFSLIESMISGALLTISVLGTFNAYAQTTDYRENVRHLTQATNVAEGVLEELLLRFNGDDDLNVGAHGPLYFDKDGEFMMTASTYTATWTVSAHPTVDGIRRVLVDVSWESKLGTRTLTLQTERP